jgi:copper(I)-binding protein
MHARLMAVALMMTAAAPAFAQEMVAKNVRVVVAAANPKDARVVGTISNPGMYSTYLVSATSDAAERVELRDARKKDAKVAEVEVPAYGALSLDAKAVYLALVNPKKPLTRGTRVEVVLSNEASVKTRIIATVGP